MFTQVVQPVFDLLYPRICASCHRVLQKNEEYLCLYCLDNLPRTYFHQHHDNPVKKALGGRLPLTHAFAYLYFKKGGIVQSLIHHIKYQSHYEIAELLGSQYGRELTKDGLEHEFDLIIPVPLHPKKLKNRGFNQSEHFGKGLAESLTIPLSNNTLIRAFESETQTRKSRLERWMNVNTIFQIADPASLRNQHVLLIDDVMTTGATLEACGQKLLEAGIAKLSIATMAVADTMT